MKKTTSEHLADYDFVVNYSVASVDKNKDQAWLLLATQELMMTKVFGSLQKILGLIQPMYRSRHSYTIKATKATALVKLL